MFPSALVPVHVHVPCATGGTAGLSLVPALVPALVPHHHADEDTSPRAMRIRTAAQEVMAAAVLLQETLTAPLVLARAHQSGVVTAFHQDGDRQATNVGVQGTRGGGAAVPGATQCGLAVPAHRLHHVRVPELVHVLHRILHTRGTVEVGLGLGPLVGAEGATVGKISEIVGPGLQHSLLKVLVSIITTCKIILSC